MWIQHKNSCKCYVFQSIKASAEKGRGKSNDILLHSIETEYSVVLCYWKETNQKENLTLRISLEKKKKKFTLGIKGSKENDKKIRIAILGASRLGVLTSEHQDKIYSLFQ